ncbi:MAG: DUF3800 domain-containing protein [Anaerolinea sp.]|nr:DUF3800 domain-containing protein [Anaerolinea sp.]
MAYFLFVDESGGQDAPNVLAGIAIKDSDLWNLVLALQDAEIRNFGRRYSAGERELKAKKILKTKTFRLANSQIEFSENEQRELARKALNSGQTAGKKELTALARAKLKYVQETLDICARFRCKAFASIFDKNSPIPSPSALRKDYSYLFERFYYFLEDKDAECLGIIVFDELEKSKSHILVDQMDSYFKRTAKGKQRASQIIPEPFFVHSDLTTGIQIADLIAYVISWGLRFEGMKEPKREELIEFVEQVLQLRTKALRDIDNRPNYTIWSFAYIPDLRSRDEQAKQ